MIRERGHITELTDSEIAENERNYLETISRIDAVEKEYRELQNSLKCRYCGKPHYSKGYCRNCYARIINGLPLGRIRKRRRKNILFICEKGFSPDSYLNSCDLNEILNHSNLSERNKECMKMYFIMDMTYDEVGKKFGITKERVRQIIGACMVKCNLKWK